MNAMQKYADKLVRNCQKYLKSSVKKTGKESLHLLRVEIKKMQALLHLLSYCNGQQYRLNKKTDRLFNRAGKIRDLELMIPQLEKHIILEGKNAKCLMKDLKREIEIRIKKFRHHYQGNEKKVFTKASCLIDEYVEVATLKKITSYFAMMKKQIYLDVQCTFRNEEQIHKLRKAIKTLKYNLKLPGNGSVVNAADKNRLEKWGTQLGKWHDTIQLVAKVNKLAMKEKSELHKQLLHISKTYSDKSQELLEQFICMK